MRSLVVAVCVHEISVCFFNSLESKWQKFGIWVCTTKTARKNGERPTVTNELNFIVDGNVSAETVRI